MTIRGVNQQRNDPLRGPVDLNNWAWSYNLNLIGKDVLPKNQYYWPVPIGTEPDPRRSWEWSYNRELIGRDTFYDGQGNAPDFDYLNRLPLGWLERQDWRQSWTWSYNLNLIGKDVLPVRNQYPPPPPVQWYQSQESWYNLNLIGKDKLPFRNQIPLPDPVTWYRSWELNLLQTTLSVVKTPFSLPSDFPNPQPVIWYRSQESWYNLNLIGKDQLPIRQQDWPLPTPVGWYQSWSQNLLETTLFVPPGLPKNQYDWPNPVGYPPGAWNFSLEGYYTQLPAQAPFNQLDWPNPIDPRAYRSWEYSYNLNLIGKDILPTLQKDFPNPYPVIWYRSQESSYPLYLIGQDKLPNNQKDWPLPYPVNWYQDYRLNLLQSSLFVIPAPPFSTNRNFDWPLPYPVIWYQFWSQSPAVPFVPLPPAPTTGGRQVGWDEIERVERFSQAFLKDHNAPVPQFYNTNPADPTIKARDAAVRLGRLGGIASGKARKK